MLTNLFITIIIVLSNIYSNDCKGQLNRINDLFQKVWIRHIGCGANGSCELISYSGKEVVLKRLDHGSGVEEENQLKEWRSFFHNRRIKEFDVYVVKVYEAHHSFMIREYVPYRTLMQHYLDKHTYSKEHREIVSDAEYAAFEITRQLNLLKQMGLMVGTNLHYGNICLDIIGRRLWIIDPV